jgi:hypothetical protein
LEDEARRFIEQQPTEAAPRDLERELHELKRQFLSDQISAAAYEERKAALLAASERTGMVSDIPIDELLAVVADLPLVLGHATASEAHAIIRPVLSHIWVQERRVTAITPTAAFTSLFRGVWEVERRCPMGFEPTAS